ncbi:MAG: 3-oxoacyl-ACP reductase FabG [Chloroflexi bacterium]|nr:3-oxoacyl-ACP reductase FabG [Chloroflexota bacterium]
MQVNLNGQVALVTGGANGIGRAIAFALATNGAHIVVLDIVPGNLARMADELEQAGASYLCLQGDVTDRAGLERIVEQITVKWGRLDILVNNAGINTNGGRVPLHEYLPETWDKIISVDLDGVFNMSRAAIPAMLKGAGGRIINISSVAGLVPLRLQSAFVAAKAGVANLTRSMALEYGPLGILVNCVAPGSTLTQGTEALFYSPNGSYSEKAASLLAHIPLGRPGRVEEIAAAVLFLAAPEASYVNGVVLPVDGGWLAGYNRDW